MHSDCDAEALLLAKLSMMLRFGIEHKHLLLYVAGKDARLNSITAVLTRVVDAVGLNMEGVTASAAEGVIAAYIELRAGGSVTHAAAAAGAGVESTTGGSAKSEAELGVNRKKNPEGSMLDVRVQEDTVPIPPAAIIRAALAGDGTKLAVWVAEVGPEVASKLLEPHCARCGVAVEKLMTGDKTTVLHFGEVLLVAKLNEHSVPKALLSSAAFTSLKTAVVAGYNDPGTSGGDTARFGNTVLAAVEAATDELRQHSAREILTMALQRTAELDPANGRLHSILQ
jgi:hypothetical protein